MIFSRKQPPALEPVEENPPKPLPDHNVELRAEWDDEKAAWEYQLYKLKNGPKGSYIGPVDTNEWHWSREVESFDKAWADRQAEHYGIEIIYPDKEA